MSEQVLVVPTRVFRGIGHFQGFCREIDPYLKTLLDPQQFSFKPRAEVEEDPSCKQLIPYVIFRHTDASGEVTLLRYTRGGGQDEKRLRRKKSIGIGGHINAVDQQTSESGNAYQEGMKRELAEEVSINTPYRESCVGLINDDQTPVGQVHLGVVHLFDVELPDVTPREEDICECGFVPVTELLRELDQFETWSQISINALFS